jgi:hypothetical protein
MALGILLARPASHRTEEETRPISADPSVGRPASVGVVMVGEAVGGVTVGVGAGAVGAGAAMAGRGTIRGRTAGAGTAGSRAGSPHTAGSRAASLHMIRWGMVSRRTMPRRTGGSRTGGHRTMRVRMAGGRIPAASGRGEISRLPAWGARVRQARGCTQLFGRPVEVVVTRVAARRVSAASAAGPHCRYDIA